MRCRIPAWFFALELGLGVLTGACSGGVDEPPEGNEASLPPTGRVGQRDRVLRDPGRGAWEEVPPSRVREQCGLDPVALRQANRLINAPWAIVRHGRICHSYRARGMLPEDAWSTTKTLGGVTAGAVAYRTRNLPRTGRKTGPFSDIDRVDHWLDSFSYNPNAQVGHVLGMVAHNDDLSLGKKEMVYDAFADVQVDTLNEMLNIAIAQDRERLGANLDDFVRRFVFEPLGMRRSSWGGGAPNKTFGFSWTTTVFDMARLGLLLLNGGVWAGEQIVSEEWAYGMSHPAFEDANTGYGYLTWVNSASNHHFGGLPAWPGWEGVQQVPRLPGPCAPVAVYREHPHGLSDSPDCNYEPPYACEQRYDVGVYQALGLFGTLIQVHPGLDMVIVVKNLSGWGFLVATLVPQVVWDIVRPAVVAEDPSYAGDDDAFCRAYGANEYAPALE